MKTNMYGGRTVDVVKDGDDFHAVNKYGHKELVVFKKQSCVESINGHTDITFYENEKNCDLYAVCNYFDNEEGDCGKRVHVL